MAAGEMAAAWRRKRNIEQYRASASKLASA
jgi:hypothetical protein